MKNILITGASGFIGHNMTMFLKSKNFNIIAFSRKNGDCYENINQNYLDDRGITSIIHLAGNAHDIKIKNTKLDNYHKNTQLTSKLYDSFLKSNAKTFIYFSSVKAVKDHTDYVLTEDTIPTPTTEYGKEKLATENYILNKIDQKAKYIYILRPCMVHGPGNKGNLNLLFKIVSNYIPWFLAKFENKRSFCSIDNICFVGNELLTRTDIPSGIYNIADDEPLSSNELIRLIAETLNRRPLMLPLNIHCVKFFAKLGDFCNFPLNTIRLLKLTETYIVSNLKIKNVIGKSLPISAKNGMIKTFQYFKK